MIVPAGTFKLKPMSKKDTLAWLKAKLVDLHREERMIESAIEHIDDVIVEKEEPKIQFIKNDMASLMELAKEEEKKDGEN